MLYKYSYKLVFISTTYGFYTRRKLFKKIINIKYFNEYNSCLRKVDRFISRCVSNICSIFNQNRSHFVSTEAVKNVRSWIYSWNNRYSDMSRVQYQLPLKPSCRIRTFSGARFQHVHNAHCVSAIHVQSGHEQMKGARALLTHVRENSPGVAQARTETSIPGFRWGHSDRLFMET